MQVPSSGQKMNKSSFQDENTYIFMIFHDTYWRLALLIDQQMSTKNSTVLPTKRRGVGQVSLNTEGS